MIAVLSRTVSVQLNQDLKSDPGIGTKAETEKVSDHLKLKEVKTFDRIVTLLCLV